VAIGNGNPAVYERGTEHDFSVYQGSYLVANVWHSDKGEWTVELPDGQLYREPNRVAAVNRCVLIAARR